MRSMMLAAVFAVSFNVGSMKAMDTKNGMSIIIGGLVTGGVVQAIRCVFANERYKQIIPFIKGYPGLTIAGISAVFGLGIIYYPPFASILGGSSVVRK